MQRCMREVASRHVTDRACSVAVSRCDLYRAVHLALCDLWPHTSAEAPQPSEAANSHGACNELYHTSSRWHAHCQAQPHTTPSTDAASGRDGVPAAMRRPMTSHIRQMQPRIARPWDSTWNSRAQPSSPPLGRGFASEGKSQTQAEKFDLIRQEAGAVRVEGCVPQTSFHHTAPHP